MGKFIKDLTDVTITYDSETMRVESITIKIKDIGCLVDRNGYFIADSGVLKGIKRAGAPEDGREG